MERKQTLVGLCQIRLLAGAPSIVMDYCAVAMATRSTEARASYDDLPHNASFSKQPCALSLFEGSRLVMIPRVK